MTALTELRATPTFDATRLARGLDAAAPQMIGSVSSIVGLSIEVCGLPGAVGDLVSIESGEAGGTVAEVVAVTPQSLRCMPLGGVHGLRVGMAARATGSPLTVPAGPQLLGRVLDGLGRPMDGKGPLVGEGLTRVPVSADAPDALQRARVDTPVGLGVSALDTLVTVGRGQRIGLFAGSGVGKSSLLSMVARGTDAEVSVIALIGERGREVREFLEDDLGPEGLARSVVVVATSDQPAMVRLRAAFVATRIAEDLRSRGQHAVLMMDSLTRVAMAQREIGLSVGEPPATRGYPPSTFSMLAQLLERAGTDATGSVTGIYTVLVDGDDHNEPIADAARSILDGHVVLSRDLAVAGHYPAIDVLGSVSRVAGRVTSAEQKTLALQLRQVLAARQRAQDLLDVGAYSPGSNRLVDAAVANADAIDGFLRQSVDQIIRSDESWTALKALVARLGVA
ncbi:FliI/YscN family ATPase [Demequina sp. NBRC 110054]|uniref:FliI/YscN family ATPase n=1 Tax=Demequina sp. NBRC 110054 TaxID=1570343 RepID=UPI000A021A70|nr:FliI/YscN family ATPase [Demequina sp. NBRC 110054]